MVNAQSNTGRPNRLGSDLAVVSLLAVSIAAVQTSLISVSEPVRILSGLLLVLLVPGYALVAAVFPRSRPILARSPEASSTFFGRSGPEADDEARRLVRLTLSLATSIAVTSLVGIALGTTAAFSTRSLAVGLAGVTLVCSLIAAVRRAGVPVEERYAPAIASGVGGFARSIGQGSRVGGVVRLVVIASLLVSMGSAAYAVSVPQQGETPTELYLLTENESGELTADDYPNDLQSNGPQTVYAGVRNYEGHEQRFTVVVTLDRVVDSDNSSTVIERAEIDRFSRTLEPNQWWRRSYEADTPLTGSNLRLTHYLYRGEAPAEPTAEGAYRVTHIQIDNTDTTQAGGGSVTSDGERQRVDTGDESSADPDGPPENESSQTEDDQTETAANETSTEDRDDEQSEEGDEQSDDESTGSDDDDEQSDNETASSDDDSALSDDDTSSNNDSTGSVNESGV